MFRKVLNDIYNAKNLDSYILVITVIIYSFLKIIDYFEFIDIDFSKYDSSLILSLFGVMAISTLQTRRADEEILNRINCNDGIFVHSFPSSFRKNIKTSDKIRIVSVTLDLINLDEFESIFNDKLKLGHKIEVLLINPFNQSALDMASKRARWESQEALKNRIISNLDILSAINEENDVKISIKVVDFPLSYSAILVEPSKRKISNLIYMAHYPYKTEKVREPKHTLQEGVDSYFNLFNEELNNLWESGIIWEGAK